MRGRGPASAARAAGAKAHAGRPSDGFGEWGRRLRRPFVVRLLRPPDGFEPAGVLASWCEGDGVADVRSGSTGRTVFVRADAATTGHSLEER
ncbi:hypothetical protein [Streptomyces sp. NPDC050287]|uniref:hypothetical protein n=1 Tax=Streptomyces sp. NPDC050287 TaxID=3365608 RepID=UPI00379369FC